MSLDVHKDSTSMKAVSLTDIVTMCQKCHELCWSKTERMVTNGSRAPSGWESLYKSIATERRQDDFGVCMERCGLVQSACPEPDMVRRYEESAAAAPSGPPGTPRGKAAAAVATRGTEQPSVQQVSRCEHAAELFSAMLFTLAHKPSKVAFENTVAQPEAAKAPTPEAASGAPTEVHKKVLRGNVNAMDDEIMRRWSEGRRARLEMERRGLLRSEDEVNKQLGTSAKGAAAPQASANSHATTPKF